MTTNAAPDYEANIAGNLKRILGERPNLNPNKIAAAMRGRGVTMDAKAVSRIVSHERRIKFNEAACLARVLEVDMDALTAPPEIARRKELAELFEEWSTLAREAEDATRLAAAAFSRMSQYVQTHRADAGEPLAELVSAWADAYAASWGLGGMESVTDSIHANLVARILPDDAHSTLSEGEEQQDV